MSDIVPVSNIPISIDYTGRDYYSIREELIARVQDRVNNANTNTWAASDPSDFGVALIEAFAYMGDLMSYYIDRNLNESLITTATQRDSVLSLATTYGYEAAGYRAANVTLTFTNSSAETITVPAGTVVSGDVTTGDITETVYFTTVDDAICDPDVDAGTANISANSGRSIERISTNATEYGELIGTSDGTPGQIWELLESPVVDNSIEIYVGDTSSHSKWVQVNHLLDYGPYNQVFTAKNTASNSIYIYFGDGISGQIPTQGYEIRAKYTVGGGSTSNIGLRVLTNIDYVPGLTHNQLIAFQGNVSVTNLETSIGGSDPEPIDQIRYSAPLALRANNRAVSLEDFRSLALQLSGIGKANALATNPTSVTLYIAPTRTALDAELSPGLNADGTTPSIEHTSNASLVADFLKNKTLIGTTVTIQPPTYADIITSIVYTKFPQYTNAEIEKAIKSKMITEFGYVNVDFQQTIYPQDVEYVLQQVTGVKNAHLTVLHRTGDTGLNTLIGAANEIFRFQESYLSVSSS